MSDLISRSALLKSIREISTSLLNEWDTMGVLNIVNKQPTVEAKEVMHGKWIIKEDESCFATWDYCSICGFTMGFAGSSHYANFCPNCGADMRTSAE